MFTSWLLCCASIISVFEYLEKRNIKLKYYYYYYYIHNNCAGCVLCTNVTVDQVIVHNIFTLLINSSLSLWTWQIYLCQKIITMISNRVTNKGSGLKARQETMHHRKWWWQLGMGHHWGYECHFPHPLKVSKSLRISCDHFEYTLCLNLVSHMFILVKKKENICAAIIQTNANRRCCQAYSWRKNSLSSAGTSSTVRGPGVRLEPEGVEKVRCSWQLKGSQP